MWVALMLLALSMDVVDMDVQLYERARAPSSRQRRALACNISVTYDNDILKEATLRSTYIFIGKVYGANSDNEKRVYRVNVRRVLKGDLNEIGLHKNVENAKSLSFIGATILVESVKDFRCSPLRYRMYAIFLTERRYTAFRLNLMLEPVLLTLRNIDIIEAAIKGKVALYLFVWKVNMTLI